MLGHLDELSECLLVAAFVRDPAGAQVLDVAADLHVPFGEARKTALALYHSDLVERAVEGGTIRVTAEARSDVDVLTARLLLQANMLSQIDRRILSNLAEHGRLKCQAVAGGIDVRNEQLIDVALGLRNRKLVKFPGAHVTIATLSAELDARGWLYLQLADLTADKLNAAHVPLAKEWILNRLNSHGSMSGEAMSEKSRYSLRAITEAVMQLSGDGLVEYLSTGFFEKVVVGATITPAGKRVAELSYQLPSSEKDAMEHSPAARTTGPASPDMANNGKDIVAAPVQPPSAATAIAAAPAGLKLHNVEREILELLANGPVILTELRKRNGRARSSFDHAFKRLQDRGLINTSIGLPNVGEAGVNVVLAPERPSHQPEPVDEARTLSTVEVQILESIRVEPSTLSGLVARTGRSLGNLKRSAESLLAYEYVDMQAGAPGSGIGGVKVLIRPNGTTWLARAISANEAPHSGKYIVANGSTSRPGVWPILLCKGTVVDAHLFTTDSLKHLLGTGTIRAATAEEVKEFEEKFPITPESVAAHQRSIAELSVTLEKRKAAAKVDSERAALCLDLIKELANKEAEIRGVLQRNFGADNTFDEGATLRWHTLRGREVLRINDAREVIKQALKEIAEPVMIAAEGLDDPQLNSMLLHELVNQLDHSQVNGPNPLFVPAEQLLHRLRYKFMSREQNPPQSQVAIPDDEGVMDCNALTNPPPISGLVAHGDEAPEGKVRNDWLVAAYKISNGGKEYFNDEIVGREIGVMRAQSQDIAIYFKLKGLLWLQGGRWLINVDGEREVERIIQQRKGRPFFAVEKARVEVRSLTPAERKERGDLIRFLATCVIVVVAMVMLFIILKSKEIATPQATVIIWVVTAAAILLGALSAIKHRAVLGIRGKVGMGGSELSAEVNRPAIASRRRTEPNK